VKLSAKRRNALPDDDFAGPHRSYPDQDRSHAIDAKARATEMWERGHITTSERKRIVNRANNKMKKARA
jgi:hypothetical protein